MLRHALPLIAMLGMVTPAMAQTPAASIEDFQGRWQIADVVGYADTSDGIPLAKELLGQTVVITTTSIDLNGEKCQPDDGFKVRQIADTTRMLSESAGAHPDDAELPPSVWMLDSSRCAPVFLLGKDRIEIDVMGVFVRAYRMK